MIRATVDGNVGSEPVLRKTGSGKAVASFSLASSEKVGQDKVTTWVDVVCWEESAEMVAEYVQKGSRLIVTGRLSQEEFKRKDGTQGVKIKLVAEDLGISLRWRPKASAGSSRGAPVSRDEESQDDGSIPF